MGGLEVLNEARSAGLSLKVQAGKIVIRGPRSAASLVRSIAEHKAELLALLAKAEPGSPPSWSTLSAERWGEADSVPGLDVHPPAWRLIVAGWPASRWKTWRDRTTELLSVDEDLPDVDRINAAERRAYDELTATHASLWQVRAEGPSQIQPSDGGQP